MADQESGNSRQPQGGMTQGGMTQGGMAQGGASQGGMQTNPYTGYTPGGGYPSYPSYNYNPTYQPGYPGSAVQQNFQQNPQGAQGFAGSPPMPASFAQPRPQQASYVENILRMNAGATVTVYMTFEGSGQWKDKIFKGVIEAAGKDHLILRDPETEHRYLLLMIYLDYVVFEGQINYFTPFSSQFYSVSQ